MADGCVPAVKLSLMTFSNFLLALAVTALALGADPLDDARNRQDRGYIRWAVTQADAAAKKNPKDAAAQYRLALTQSVRAEVALEAGEFVDSGPGAAAFLLNATRVQEVRDVADHGEKMPQKSTYFYPKPCSGVVMNRITE